jgi:uncharacterized protein (DUF58 family)
MTILSRYLDPEVLGRLAGRRLDPRGLVVGNLAGAHHSPLAGFAVEFAGHRPYVWGDDPKHIDWRVYFTRDKYVIKQYEQETNLVCHLLLDVSASMRYGEGRRQKLQYACEAAVTLAHAVVRQSDKVSLATFDDRVRQVIAPGASLAQVLRMTEHLAAIQPVGKTRMADCLTELAGRMGRREIVMLFSDLFTDLQAIETALARFRFHRHEVVLFHVLHHDELTFDLDGMVKFQGLESADHLLARPEDLRRGYLAALAAYLEQLDGLCQRNRIERVLLDTSRDLGQTLVDYLNQRALLNRSRHAH